MVAPKQSVGLPMFVRIMEFPDVIREAPARDTNEHLQLEILYRPTTHKMEDYLFAKLAAKIGTDS